MRSAGDIASLFYERRQSAGVERQRMRDVCALYEGAVAIDLTELSVEERPAVINFARMGINQTAMRAAGVMPMVEHFPVDHGKREAARKRSDVRRKVTHGWWGESKQNLVLRQRARWMFAYASAPVLIWPDMAKGCPVWMPRSPLDTFAAPTWGVGDYCPADVIFAQARTVGWVRKNYPQHALHFHRSGNDDLVDVIEYVDHEQYHRVLCLGTRLRHGMEFAASAREWVAEMSPGVTLQQLPNRAGVPWAVVPKLISLERSVGLYDGIAGMYQAQARLQALSLHARMKGVFQEEWLVATQDGITPDVIRKADALTGEVGIVTGGRFERFVPDPQYATDTGIDRLERAQRVEAGIPGAWGGEGMSNVRTGRGVETILGAATDPLLQETHELFATSLTEENRIAIAIDRGYWGSESKTFFVAFNGDKGNVTYTPADLWETDRHVVRYPFPGGDVDSINIATGQAMGAGIMSRKTAATLNPLVENPEVEFDQIVAERLQDAFLTQVQTMAATPGGGWNPVDLAQFIRLVKSDQMEMLEAFDAVQKAAQERQAREAETLAQTMPGVAEPGGGVEQPGMFQTQPDQQGLSQLLYSLRAPQMRAAAERV